jgi:hypothetical protein
MVGTHYRETKTWQVYELPSPVNWAEIGKVISCITRELEETGVSLSDDAVWATAEDDKIMFRYEVKDQKQPA